MMCKWWNWWGLEKICTIHYTTMGSKKVKEHCLFVCLFVWSGVKIHDRKASEHVATEPWIVLREAYYYTTMHCFIYNVRFFFHFHFVCLFVWLIDCLIRGWAVKWRTSIFSRIHDRRASEHVATEPWIVLREAYYYTTMDRFIYVHFFGSFCLLF